MCDHLATQPSNYVLNQFNIILGILGILWVGNFVKTALVLRYRNTMADYDTPDTGFNPVTCSAQAVKSLLKHKVLSSGNPEEGNGQILCWFLDFCDWERKSHKS